jgi:hypothetical protein
LKQLDPGRRERLGDEYVHRMSVEAGLALEFVPLPYFRDLTAACA